MDADHRLTCLPQGLGCEDALTHLLNYVWPNIFETSPHVVNAVNGAIDGCRLALGPAVVMSYTLQVRSSLKGVLKCTSAVTGLLVTVLLVCWQQASQECAVLMWTAVQARSHGDGSSAPALTSCSVCRGYGTQLAR